MEEYIIGYPDLVTNKDTYTLKELGQKAYYLYKSLDHVDIIPPFNVISSRFYAMLLETHNLTPPISENQFEKISPTVEELTNNLPSSFFQPFSTWGKYNIAIRPSISSNLETNTSFTGMLPSFMGIKTKMGLTRSLIQIFKVLFSKHTYLYLRAHDLTYRDINVAVMIQKQMYPEVSGTSYSLDPITGAKSRISIEAVFGLGDTIAKGEIIPDVYIVDLHKREIFEKKISPQQWMRIISKDKKHNVIDIQLSKLWQYTQKLPDDKIIDLAEITKNLATQLNSEIMVEWGISGNTFYIFQIKPLRIKTIPQSKPMVQTKQNNPALEQSPALLGTPLSPGKASGYIKKIIGAKPDLSNADKPIIVVAEQFSDVLLDAIMHPTCKGFIIDIGSPSSDAAVIAQDLGLPAIGNTFYATKILNEGEFVTIDGFTGAIYTAEKQPSKTSTALNNKTNTPTITLVSDTGFFEYPSSNSLIILESAINMHKLKKIAAKRNRKILLVRTTSQKELDNLKNQFIPKYVDDIYPILSDFQTLSNIKELFYPSTLANPIIIDINTLTKKLKNTNDKFLFEILSPLHKNGVDLWGLTSRELQKKLKHIFSVFSIVLIHK